MRPADTLRYLEPVIDQLAKQWPGNKTVNIVCHGHSVPSGYFATPYVNTFEAYPHLLHKTLKERFPFAVINVIVTAVGGEDACGGFTRFEAEALNHNPSVITIDYALNDRRIGLKAAETAWRGMIEKALAGGVKPILVTPSWEQSYLAGDEQWSALVEHAAQVRSLAGEYGIGLADAFLRFEESVKSGRHLAGLLSHINHPSRLGHQLIADELAAFFMAR